MEPAAEQAINFFSEGVVFSFLDEGQVQDWLMRIVHVYNASLDEINYIFCSDEYLLTLNKQYLDHDYYTDILTFPNSEPGQPISADIYISIERVRENAQAFQSELMDELARVMVHGLLHLLGFDDHSPEAAAQMREAEDVALAAKPF
ncbi:MAG: rRNA maturation RNase YbeY [Bacteroidia bacterium]